MTEMTAVDEGVARELQRAWDEGWNRGDVDTIMSTFARDVVFSSPFVSKLTGDAATTSIEGYEALRAYVDESLRRAPGIRYTVDASYIGTDSIVLVYTVHRPDGTDKTGADLMRIDGDGKIVDWRCHYASDFLGDDVRYLMDSTQT
jgi:SnoaL-like protein